jgi:hypothetical protein
VVHDFDKCRRTKNVAPRIARIGKWTPKKEFLKDIMFFNHRAPRSKAKENKYHTIFRDTLSINYREKIGF